MTRVQLFPTLLILLDLAAAIVWALDHDVRKTVYWTSAAVLTAAVTF